MGRNVFSHVGRLRSRKPASSPKMFALRDAEVHVFSSSSKSRMILLMLTLASKDLAASLDEEAELMNMMPAVNTK